ncbi:MAG: LamG domain-containing protein [Spirochaetes bacterium]|nr:LamG domain-containing protein [Spirochaetota bacterium]
MAIGLDGNTQNIIVANHADFNSTTISICAWIWIDASNPNNAIVNKAWTTSHASPYYQYFLEHIYSGGTHYIRAHVTIGGTVRQFTLVGAAMGFGAWHHIGFTYDGSNGKIFVDGDKDLDDNSYSGALATTQTQEVYIGDNKNVANFDLDGKMFDVRIYNTAISDANMTSIYSDGNGCDGITSGLVGRWEMREESGTAGTVVDTSGGGHDGTATDSPSYVADPFNACVSGGGADITGMFFSLCR